MSSGSNQSVDVPEQADLVAVEDDICDEDGDPLVSSEQGTEVKQTSDGYRHSQPDILCLPDEIFIFIGQFLNLKDLLHLSQTNKRLYKVFSTHNKTWTRFFLEFHLTRSAFFEKSVAGNCNKLSSI